MRGRKTIISVVVVATAATIALFSAPNVHADYERRIVIEIKGFEFQPEMPTVQPGDVIVWVNKDIVPHTATAVDGSWDSGLIESGGQWQLTFEENMVLDYYCKYHPSMVAQLQIESTSESDDKETPRG